MFLLQFLACILKSDRGGCISVTTQNSNANGCVGVVMQGEGNMQYHQAHLNAIQGMLMVQTGQLKPDEYALRVCPPILKYSVLSACPTALRYRR